MPGLSDDNQHARIIRESTRQDYNRQQRCQDYLINISMPGLSFDSKLSDDWTANQHPCRSMRQWSSLLKANTAWLSVAELLPYEGLHWYQGLSSTDSQAGNVSMTMLTHWLNKMTDLHTIADTTVVILSQVDRCHIQTKTTKETQLWQCSQGQKGYISDCYPRIIHQVSHSV